MRIHPARVVTIATLLAVAVASCAKKSAGDGDAPVAAAAPASLDSKGLKAPVEAGRKVIHTGHVELVVDTFDEARGKLDALVREAGGYIDSTDVSHHDTSRQATIVLRIPSDGFGGVLGKLGTIGRVASETTSAADITDQYVDVAARLASTKALEKRLLELAADRTTATVDQVLSIERELARVRGEIEGYEGHVRQWDDQISMSTLTLSITSKRVAPTEASLGARSSEAFAGSIDALRETGAGCLVVAIALLPWLVICVPSFLIGRRLWRRLRPQMPKAIVQPPVA